MVQTILVPLDSSKRAEAILPHVEALARLYHAKVVLLQVVEPTYPSMGARDVYWANYQEDLDQRITQAESDLAIVSRRLGARGIDVRTSVGFGPVVEAILDAAQREGADLIAMASHGRTGLARAFYGSVAAGILHRIDRPLLLVRSQDED